MSQPPRIIVTGRSPHAVEGMTMVMAEVDGGVTGHYMIANELVGTQDELDEIAEQSLRRKEAIDATKAGQS